MRHKLSNPQACLLLKASGPGGVRCHARYQPAIKLQSLGLVTLLELAFEQAQLTITDAGRAWLAEQEKP